MKTLVAVSLLCLSCLALSASAEPNPFMPGGSAPPSPTGLLRPPLHGVPLPSMPAGISSTSAGSQVVGAFNGVTLIVGKDGTQTFGLTPQAQAAKMAAQAKKFAAAQAKLNAQLKAQAAAAARKAAWAKRQQALRDRRLARLKRESAPQRTPPLPGAALLHRVPEKSPGTPFPTKRP